MLDGRRCRRWASMLHHAMHGELAVSHADTIDRDLLFGSSSSAWTVQCAVCSARSTQAAARCGPGQCSLGEAIRPVLSPSIPGPACAGVTRLAVGVGVCTSCSLSSQPLGMASGVSGRSRNRQGGKGSGQQEAGPRPVRQRGGCAHGFIHDMQLCVHTLLYESRMLSHPRHEKFEYA